MSDWDAVIIGGGPAGLTAGLYLARGNWRTLLLEKENVGGYIMNVEMIENYPGFAEGVPGSQLAMEMRHQATRYGLKIEHKEAASLRASPDQKWITCPDGTMHSAKAVIIAGGSIPKKLGVPGEEELRGMGVFSCAFCDGGDYLDRVVAVCGGGDAGVTEALYLSRIASKVIVIEALPQLTATGVLRDRVQSDPKLEVHCGMKVTRIIGEGQVTGIELAGPDNSRETLKVDGVLVHVGLDPNTGYLEGVVPLDGPRQVIVNEWMETKIPGVFAAGDIRSNSPRQVSAAVGDGATAGMAAQRFLQKQPK